MKEYWQRIRRGSLQAVAASDRGQRHHRGHPPRLVDRSRLRFRIGFPSGRLAMTMRTRCNRRLRRC